MKNLIEPIKNVTSGQFVDIINRMGLEKFGTFEGAVAYYMLMILRQRFPLIQQQIKYIPSK